MTRFRIAFVPLVLVIVAALAWMALPGCGGKSSSSSAPGAATATVTGVVKDAVSSNAISGATVKASSGASTTSDANGHFTISVAANASVRLDVTETTHSLNQVVMTLSKNETRPITVNLIAKGTTSNVTVASGGTVTDGSGASLKLPANFVTTAGNVSVTVTGLDPTTDQVKALPGGLDAIDGGGHAVYLKPVSFAEYTVKDGSGNTLQFNPSASSGANIELPIPASLRGQAGYQTGDPIECYVYDPADGKWKTPVPGMVGPSTTDGSTPVIKATIFHLSWYGGAPATSDIACVEGTVTLNGSPAPNVYVEAFPGGHATTDASGHYQVQATANSTIRVDASVQVGTGFRTASGSIQTGAAGAACAHLDLSLGSVVAGQYSVTGFLSSNWLDGLVTGDLAFVIINVGSGSTSNPVVGATVQIGTGNTWTTLTDEGSGEYAIGGGFTQTAFWLKKGATYTLRCDFNNDGTWDATSTGIFACGVPVLTAPANHATVGKSFTMSWTDSGSAVQGYLPVYEGGGSSDAGGALFATTARTFVLGNNVTDPVSHLPNPPVVAGDYTLYVYAGDGPIYRPLVGGSGAANVTGPNTSGIFYSLSTSTFDDSVTCTGVTPSLAAGARPASVRPSPAVQALQDRLQADRQRVQAALARRRGQGRLLRAGR